MNYAIPFSRKSENFNKIFLPGISPFNFVEKFLFFISTLSVNDLNLMFKCDLMGYEDCDF